MAGPGEIYLDNAAAVEELLSLADEPLLGNPALALEGRTLRAYVSDLTFDEVEAAGGRAEAGGFSAVVHKKDFEGLNPPRPQKLDLIEARGMSLYVLQVFSGTAHFVITAGEPVDEDE